MTANPQPPGAPGEGKAHGNWLAFAACSLLALGLLVAAYANFFRNAFHFDDSHVVSNNVYIRSLKNAPRFFADARTFSSQPMNCAYRPLVPLTLAVDYRLAGGLDPVPYRVTQLALMALLGITLGWFYRRIMDWAIPGPWNGYLALFAAALFCLHTVNTETMNLIHARSEIVSALGLVLGFLLWLECPGLRKTCLYLVPVILGALAKLPAVLFAPLLFVWLLLEPQAGEPPECAPRWVRIRRAAVASAPAFGLSVILYVFIEEIMGPPTLNYGGGDRTHYALTQAWVWVHYIRLFFLPVGLTADTDLELIATWHDTRVFAGLTLIGLLALVAWRASLSRTGWPIAFGIAWFALGLLPTSSVLPLAEPLNEHRIFLPYIGFILAVVWAARLGLGALSPRSRLGHIMRGVLIVTFCVLVLFGHAFGTHARNEVWRTDESLWADVTRKSPRNGRGWMNYGVALMARAQYPQAKSCFERALELSPNYYALHTNLGIISGAMGDQRAAEEHFRRALRLSPTQPTTHHFYAWWLAKQGRAKEALPHLEESLHLSPADESSRLLLMNLLAARGDLKRVTDLAREHLALVGDNPRARAYASGGSPIRVSPATYDAYFNEGLALGKTENFTDSALAYRAALALDPRSADALNNLGWTLGKLGFTEEAVPLLEDALRIRPDFQLARNNLAWVMSRPH